jgi:hypothetical protein
MRPAGLRLPIPGLIHQTVAMQQINNEHLALLHGSATDKHTYNGLSTVYFDAHYNNMNSCLILIILLSKCVILVYKPVEFQRI